jgi:Fes/CIP4, and EFC/F-BAR homology domain
MHINTRQYDNTEWWLGERVSSRSSDVAAERDRETGLPVLRGLFPSNFVHKVVDAVAEAEWEQRCLGTFRRAWRIHHGEPVEPLSSSEEEGESDGLSAQSSDDGGTMNTAGVDDDGGDDGDVGDDGRNLNASGDGDGAADEPPGGDSSREGNSRSATPSDDELASVDRFTSLPFEQGFALRVCTERCEHGLAVVRECAEGLRRRAALEEEYCKKLQNLAERVTKRSRLLDRQSSSDALVLPVEAQSLSSNDLNQGVRRVLGAAFEQEAAQLAQSGAVLLGEAARRLDLWAKGASDELAVLSKEGSRQLKALSDAQHSNKKASSAFFEASSKATAATATVQESAVSSSSSSSSSGKQDKHERQASKLESRATALRTRAVLAESELARAEAEFRTRHTEVLDKLQELDQQRARELVRALKGGRNVLVAQTSAHNAFWATEASASLLAPSLRDSELSALAHFEPDSKLLQGEDSEEDDFVALDMASFFKRTHSARASSAATHSEQAVSASILSDEEREAFPEEAPFEVAVATESPAQVEIRRRENSVLKLIEVKQREREGTADQSDPVLPADLLRSEPDDVGGAT